MRMLLRLFAVLLALAILAGVVHLGIVSGKDPAMVVWFGIASAIAAPVGLSLLGFALARDDAAVIQRLAKVPEIERLIAEASNQEERLKLLEEQHERLVETVRFAARRQAVMDRRVDLERDAGRLIGELDTLDEELRILDIEVGESTVTTEVNRLREIVGARASGDLLIRAGDRVYRIDRDILLALPLNLGHPILAYFRIYEKLRRKSAKPARADLE